MNRKLEKYLWFYIGPLLAAIGVAALNYYLFIVRTGVFVTTTYFGIQPGSLVVGLSAGYIFGSLCEYAKAKLGPYYK